MGGQSWNHLQPLRIPGGWTVVFNKLEMTEPEGLSPEDSAWLFAYTQDILYMYRDLGTGRRKQKLGIDLGWYPDGDPLGNFRLLAVLNDNWELPLLVFTSRSKKEVVNMLEKWLFCEFLHCGFIEENVFAKTIQAYRNKWNCILSSLPISRVLKVVLQSLRDSITKRGEYI